MDQGSEAAAVLHCTAAFDILQATAEEPILCPHDPCARFKPGRLQSAMLIVTHLCAPLTQLFCFMQPFLLAAMHYKVTSLATVGMYLFEPISTSPEDPQILQVS